MLVVTSLTGEDRCLHDLQRTGLGIVAVERPLSGIYTDCVIVENRAGAELAVKSESGMRIPDNVALIGSCGTRVRRAGIRPDSS